MSKIPNNKDSSFSEVSEIVSEYTEWYSHILRLLLYPEDADLASLPNRNTEIFMAWTEKARKQDVLEEGVFQKLHGLYEDFHKLIEELTWKAQEKKTRLSRADFDRLTAFYEDFLLHLRRLERDSSLKDSGIDALTGLRHRSVMVDDLEKEMERLARRGRAFSMALARIDRFKDLQKEHGAEKVLDYTKITAELIKRSIRSFDDAYRLNNGLFLLSLKQADITGGLAALERLKKLLEHQDTHVTVGGKDIPMTLSCCIAEPVVGDNVNDLIDNLKTDLDLIEDAEGTVLEYYEMSPLQRYIKTGEDA